MIETNDLTLHSGSPEDWEELYEALWSRKEAFAYMFQKASPSPEHARKKTAAYAEMHREISTEYFIYLKKTGRAIGIAGLKAYTPTLYTVTDIVVGPDYWHLGYGRQVLLSLTHAAWTLGAERVLFNCFRENDASRRLALACSYHYVRTVKAELKKNGETVWMDYFEINKAAE